MNSLFLHLLLLYVKFIMKVAIWDEVFLLVILTEIFVKSSDL